MAGEKDDNRIHGVCGDDSLTNREVCVWDTERRTRQIRTSDALNVAAMSESIPSLATVPEPAVPDSELRQYPWQRAAPGHLPAVNSWDEQILLPLTFTYMQSGFEPESVNDVQLIELLDLNDYPVPTYLTGR